MPWDWVNDLFAPDNRKRTHTWNVRCPFKGESRPGRGDGCPSNYPFHGANPPRIKYIQKIGLFVYQYKCKDCGAIFNVSDEIPDGNEWINNTNPALWGNKPDYKFYG